MKKFKELRTFISDTPQNENTVNQLSYPSELKKVNGKKYQLVFEEHLEEIDEVLDTLLIPRYLPKKELFIDIGGQMNVDITLLI